MTRISISDLKINAGKYVNMAQEQDIFITKNGKVVAKLVTAKADKKAAWDSLTGIFKGIKIDEEDIERAREERILE